VSGNDAATVGSVRAQAAALLTASGVPDEAAQVTAKALTVAESWGLSSHGLMRLPYYLARLQAGGVNPAAELALVQDTGPVVAYDGQGGLGHWQLWKAAEIAAQRCATYGLAAVSVGNSSHCGCLGVYTVPVVDAGYLALVFSNGPAVMPPWGGSQPLLSTSPLAAGIPCRPKPAIVDMATTAVARGRIAERAHRGEALPEGWALDSTGAPTVDAQAALVGMLAPLGGAKGYAIALLVEALTGGLVGPALSTDVSDMFDADVVAVPQRIAHLVLAIDPARMDVDGKAQQRLDALAANVGQAGGRLPGERRRHPDEISLDEPLDLAPRTAAELAEWQVRLGVAEAARPAEAAERR
jgi:(2R)-3-sulfolactate dehydrogenase (NADP+)